MDLYPTLTELCGLRQPDGLEGTSLAPLLDDAGRPWKRAAFTTMGRGKDRTEAATDIEFLGHSVRTERWRYTEWDGGKQGIELYEHSTDPLEIHNLHGRAEVAKSEAELKDLLHRGWKYVTLPLTRGG